MRSILIAVFLLLPSVCEAQLFPNAPWNRGGGIQQRSGGTPNCANGQCNNGARQQITPATATDYGYPGVLSSHLQSSHGISSAGMSHRQMVDAHNAAHRGYNQPIRDWTSGMTQQMQPLVSPQPVIRVAPQPVYRAPVSTLQPTRAPSLPSDELFGLGAMLEPRSVELPKHVLGQIAEPEEVTPLNDRGFFREVGRAIAKARSAGKINAREAVRLRVAMLSPAFAKAAEELAVTQMAFSGEDSEHVPVDADGVVQMSGIKWENLPKYIEALLPLLLALLKMFGL